ncbi:MAG: hypothetical protein IJH47_07660, partial [Oscillospiraceae bacterium]|nr:hypothetical protein [Oscillospiraceae bacterium]
MKTFYRILHVFAIQIYCEKDFCFPQYFVHFIKNLSKRGTVPTDCIKLLIDLCLLILGVVVKVALDQDHGRAFVAAAAGE